MEPLNEEIDRLLDRHRPARYDSSDKAWMAPVESAVADRIPITEARRRAAAEIVRRREAEATKSANRLLRTVGETGQPPLDWMDMACRPIAWGEHRVRLDEATPRDFLDWATEERRRADRDHEARIKTVEGAELIGNGMAAAKVRTIADYWPRSAAA